MSAHVRTFTPSGATGLCGTSRFQGMSALEGYSKHSEPRETLSQRLPDVLTPAALPTLVGAADEL